MLDIDFDPVETVEKAKQRVPEECRQCFETPGFPLIELTPEDLRECDSYAERRREQDQFPYYEARGQSNSDTIFKQIRQGKLGEICAHRTLRSVTGVSAPDFEIYSPSEKSWDSDLKTANHGIAVKTDYFDDEMRLPVSWTFQWANIDTKGGIDKEIFYKKPNLIVALVVINNDYSLGRVLSLNAVENIPDYLFEHPYAKPLQGIKKCIYLSTLNEKGFLNSCVSHLLDSPVQKVGSQKKYSPA